MNQEQTLIQQLQLAPHPEGGWYRELHRSQDRVQRQDGVTRSALTAILFLLPADAVSCWHRVIGADEAWTHIDGATLELFQCQADGTALRRDALDEANPVQVVPANVWQAARSLGDYSLVSCCVGPGFDFLDFEMVRQQAATERLKWPHPELI
ncbi:cupin [Synechococcus sp. KORDI-52]|uniref:cupin domain-containing protein n=1 Tax=Synechococcus sp. KORDI-52 TaxID=585425 RepID=UPI0004E06300|nr:cupin domain-containing protein [Synechococcus sp. KORDI-52]AII47731.1 cupin [Synechococcus sp. KORDI-52]